MPSKVVRHFLEHHTRLLSRIERLEWITREIGGSAFPASIFEKHRPEISEFFRFIETQGQKHVQEEERILLPALLGSELAKQLTTRVSLAQMQKEHRKSRRLLRLQKKRFLHLLRANRDQPHCYYHFCASMLDLIWHFRRHIWRENCFLLAEVDEVLPGRELDRLWDRLIALSSVTSSG